ncbi:hypothetical protein U1P98_01110 [Lysinibacillus irui]|uniref:Uncharacterized protein n=1 Tax=Lysinibacillus irui TaxID=2998077 RepID=A0ABU5NFQ7_9BACI|nr:hypothetical protein [Lysinibacillus irui]MEA0554181.1 hypothetical protein [Lysinibacillus irui]MEA0974877.1 hypothetical protein [Lysinibacillus irui]MEA1041031.1 hypothetical protein [Lysinibacillus irui]
MSKNSRELIYLTSKVLNDIDGEARHINKQLKSLQRKAKNEAPKKERDLFLNGCKATKQGVKKIQREVLKLRFKKPELVTVGQLQIIKDEIIRQSIEIDQIYQELMR